MRSYLFLFFFFLALSVYVKYLARSAPEIRRWMSELSKELVERLAGLKQGEGQAPRTLTVSFSELQQARDGAILCFILSFFWNSDQIAAAGWRANWYRRSRGTQLSFHNHKTLRVP